MGDATFSKHKSTLGELTTTGRQRTPLKGCTLTPLPSGGYEVRTCTGTVVAIVDARLPKRAPPGEPPQPLEVGRDPCMYLHAWAMWVEGLTREHGPRMLMIASTAGDDPVLMEVMNLARAKVEGYQH